jgi:acetyl-CoA carboxylase beta subunit
MSLLRKHLKDNEWLLASGLADRIVNQQRTLRMKREKAVEARAHKNAALLKR